MIVSPEFLTIVAATDKVTFTSTVSIIGSPIFRSITITFTLITRILGCATSPAVEVTTGTTLPCFGLQWYTRNDDRWFRCWKVFWLITAVVFFMEVRTKLLAIVAPADKVSFASPMTVVHASIKRSVTVAFA